jgi:GTP-binding protein LepA
VGDRIKLMATGARTRSSKLGVFTPAAVGKGARAGRRRLRHRQHQGDARRPVGDTVTWFLHGATQALPGFKRSSRWCSRASTRRRRGLRRPADALEKLKLNDSAITIDPETSDALGWASASGSSGLLHMEIVQERLEREYDLDLITTAPSVVYKVIEGCATARRSRDPVAVAAAAGAKGREDPASRSARLTIHCPEAHIGGVLKLCEERRGTQVGFEYSAPGASLIATTSRTRRSCSTSSTSSSRISRGYASMDYEITDWREDDLVKVDILLNGEMVDALSLLCHREQAHYKGAALTRKLKEFIPRQMFEVAIQAADRRQGRGAHHRQGPPQGRHAKCYGGDISRKRKLLEKQKKGKKRMKSLGHRRGPAGGVPRRVVPRRGLR